MTAELKVPSVRIATWISPRIRRSESVTWCVMKTAHLVAGTVLHIHAVYVQMAKRRDFLLCTSCFLPGNYFPLQFVICLCIYFCIPLGIYATGWTIGVLEFDSRRRLGVFLFTTASRTALRPTQPPIQWLPGSLSLGVKRPGREADHSPPSSAEVKECV
jgi:hypothetical protein